MLKATFNSHAPISTITSAITSINQGLDQPIPVNLEPHGTLPDRTIIVGSDQTIMMLIGAIANMGHDGLIDVTRL